MLVTTNGPGGCMLGHDYPAPGMLFLFPSRHTGARLWGVVSAVRLGGRVPQPAWPPLVALRGWHFGAFLHLVRAFFLANFRFFGPQVLTLQFVRSILTAFWTCSARYIKHNRLGRDMKSDSTFKWVSVWLLRAALVDTRLEHWRPYHALDAVQD